MPLSPPWGSALPRELQTSSCELREAADSPFPAPDLSGARDFGNGSRASLSEPGSSLPDLLTVILTTSPMQSNPSTEVLARVLSSFRLVPGLEQCSKVVVFDGYEVHGKNELKSGRVMAEQAWNYEQYVECVQCAMSGGSDALAQAKRSTVSTRVTRRTTCEVNVIAVPSAPSRTSFGCDGVPESWSCSMSGSRSGSGSGSASCEGSQDPQPLSADCGHQPGSCSDATILEFGERAGCQEEESAEGGSSGSCSPVAGEDSRGTEGAAGGCEAKNVFDVEQGDLCRVQASAEAGGCGSCDLVAEEGPPTPPPRTPPGPSPSITFLRPHRRLGFALAIRAALSAVHTPYVMVAQHDWAFTAPLDAGAILRAMQEHDKWVHYVGFVSAGTLAYAGKGAAQIGLPALEAEGERFGIPLVKLCFWYDKTHIARSDHYRRFVFGHGRFRKGDFIEDTFGHEMLEDIKTNGIGAHEKYGTFLYYEGDGLRRYIHHIDGRKFLLPAQKAEKEAASRAAGNGGRRRRKQIERERREREKREAEASAEGVMVNEWES